MTPIQPILVLLLICGTILYFARMRSKLLDRMVVAVLAGAGICLVSFPNVTILIANSLGVGRGVDLVIYLALLAIGFLIALIYSKIREIEGRITMLSREIAVSRAEDGRSKP